MHIIVPIKQVPETDEQRYDPRTRTLVREGITSVINPYDKRALTEAVRLRALYGGSITAVTMGPPHARDALVECLGRGVGRAIHLTDRAFAGSDTLATARTLAALLRRLSFDLLLLGKFSTDSETGQVGPELAELLDLPQVTGATAIERLDNGMLRVLRETDTGFEEVELALPALLTAAEHLIKPTKTKPAVLEEGHRRIDADPGLIKTWSAYDLGIPDADAGLTGSPTWVSELRPIEMDRKHVMLQGDMSSSLSTLLATLEATALKAGSIHEQVISPRLPDPIPNPRPDRSVWAVAELLTSDAQHFTNSKQYAMRRVSLELMGEAARLASLLGGEAASVVMGSGIPDAMFEELAQHGAQRIILADSPLLENYTTERYAWLLANAIREQKPWAVLLPATAFGRDLAPRVAARLGLGLTGDCIGLELDREGRLLQLKPAFGGQVIAPIISRTLPVMSTLRPGVLPLLRRDNPQPPQVTQLSLDGVAKQRVRILSHTHDGEAGLALDVARLVVCVGMGIGGAGALPEVYKLASLLGEWMGFASGEIAVAGTRKVIDAGWLPRHQQIGITGRVVTPDLYMGLGLSGNFNHTSGIMRSRMIAAVNTDRNAPIFDVSDIGIVGDWRDFADVLRRVASG